MYIEIPAGSKLPLNVRIGEITLVNLWVTVPTELELLFVPPVFFVQGMEPFL